MEEPGKFGRSNLRDLIHGGIDGDVTTFAIVAGVERAGLSSRVVVALGIANVLADGSSVAAGDYSGTKAEPDEHRRLRSLEATWIDGDPEAERADLRRVLAAKGLAGHTLDEATGAISARRVAWIEMMLLERHGRSPADPDPLRAVVCDLRRIPSRGDGAAGAVPVRHRPALPGLDRADARVLRRHRRRQEPLVAGPWLRSSIALIGGTAALTAYLVGSLFAGP